MASSNFAQTLRSRLPKVFLQTIILYSYYHLITEYFYDIAKCQGLSMEPTLYSDDYLIIKKIDKYSIKKGDIIILRSPSSPEKFVCKRVVHTAGDLVYCPSFSGKIPKGSIWIEGDNSAISVDSRHYGPVPKGLIWGKATYVIWPFMRDLTAF